MVEENLRKKAEEFGEKLTELIEEYIDDLGTLFIVVSLEWAKYKLLRRLYDEEEHGIPPFVIL